ncbi:MAG TPA: glycoside hydrolase family 88 protein [Verrucomicrobiae bacterium]
MKIREFLYSFGIFALTTLPCLSQSDGSGADAIDLGQALNQPDWAWQTNAVGWLGEANASHDAVSAAQSGSSAPSQTSSLQTSVVGPGTVRFWWKSTSKDSHDKLLFFVNGSQKKSISGNKDWQLVTYSVSGTSTQSFRWDYAWASSSTETAAAGFLDQVDFGTNLPPMLTTQPAGRTNQTGTSAQLKVSINGTSPFGYQWQMNGASLTNGNGISGATSSTLSLSPVQLGQAGYYTVIVTNTAGASTSIVAHLTVVRVFTLAEALDAGGLTWKTSGSPAWIGESNVTHDGQSAAQSGAIAHGKSGSFSTSVTGPGQISFWWKVSSETNNDVLTFQIGSTEKARISGEVDWAQAGPFAVPSGSQTLKWIYKKNSSGKAGLDAGWVDQVVFAPPPPPRIFYSTNSDVLPGTNDIAGAMILANDYFIANNTHQTNGWARGVYQAGNVRAYQALGIQRYYDTAVQWGTYFNWQPGWRGPTNADGEVCGQAYVDLYRIDPQPVRIAGIQAGIDNRVAYKPVDDWWWIDAFFMAGPVYARLGELYQTNSYFDKLAGMYQDMKVRRGLYDASAGLWYRDADAQGAKTKNGQKQFWSRGNGWVMAACARVLEQNPLSPTQTLEYASMLQQMAAVLKPLQGSDGFWRASLIDAAEVPNPETSGTALFCYAMAWGIRNGYLDSGEYLPVVARAWNGMVRVALHSDGKLGYVQPQGKFPDVATYDDAADHGVGPFLMAGSEVLLLSGATPPDPVISPDLIGFITSSANPGIPLNISIVDDLVQVSWKTSPGVSYQVLYKDNLGDNWQELDAEVTVTDGIGVALDWMNGDGLRVYKVLGNNQ